MYSVLYLWTACSRALLASLHTAVGLVLIRVLYADIISLRRIYVAYPLATRPAIMRTRASFIFTYRPFGTGTPLSGLALLLDERTGEANRGAGITYGAAASLSANAIMAAHLISSICVPTEEAH